MSKQKKCRFCKNGECRAMGGECDYRNQEECEEYEPPYEDSEKTRTVKRKNDRRNKQRRDYDDE